MTHAYNVLYVDDEKHNLTAFTASFRRHYNVFTAQSASEAFELMRSQHNQQQPIHLIVSDQRMPEMSGVELLEKLLPEFPDTVRMILTAYNDLESTIQAINRAKVYQFVNKPWNASELKLLIDNALESYRLKVENRALQEERLQLLVQTERQAKENILAKFEMLKSQVNPHFLFNSLNALSSLIYKNPESARSFVQKLSNVYRYIIDQREAELVTLTEELNFVRSYFFLQKIRFGDNLLLVEQNLPEADPDCLVPPLALQLLVENAIKHNIVSREYPLTIELYREGDYLVVRNTYQKRITEETSTGIGLQNLRERYHFLSDLEPAFYQEGTHFYAKIPLLSGR